MAGTHGLGHLHLVAAQLRSVKPSRGDQEGQHPPLCFGSCPISRVEALGVVCTLQWKEKCTRFGIDDGTGVVNCVVWRESDARPRGRQHHGPLTAAARQALSVQLMADVVDTQAASALQHGKLVRVQGRLNWWLGAPELSVTSLLEEMDPNAEILHWCKVMQLWRRCYSRWFNPSVECSASQQDLSSEGPCSLPRGPPPFLHGTAPRHGHYEEDQAALASLARAPGPGDRVTGWNCCSGAGRGREASASSWSRRALEVTKEFIADASGVFDHSEWLQNPHLRREASEVLTATMKGGEGPLPEAVDAMLRQVLRELRDMGEVFQICPQIGRFSVNAADELIKPAVLRGLPKAGVGRGSASGMAAEAVIAGLRREEPRLRRVGGAAISRALDSLVQEGRVCEAAEGRFARVAPMYKHGPAV